MNTAIMTRQASQPPTRLATPIEPPGQAAPSTADAGHTPWLAVLDTATALVAQAAVDHLAQHRTVAAARGTRQVLDRAPLGTRMAGLLAVGRVLHASGVHDEAAAVLSEGRALAAAAGDTSAVTAFDRSLHHISRTRGGGRPPTGWAALTDAEWRVVEQVARGLTYREVGRELSVSRRTVESHTASVFRKLGVRRRQDLIQAYRTRQRAEPWQDVEAAAC